MNMIPIVSNTTTRLLISSFLAIILICSCANKNEIEPNDSTKTDITKLEGMINIGDSLSSYENRVLVDPYWTMFRNGSSIDAVFKCYVDSHKFHVSQDTDGLINYIYTDDTTLITPEGVYVGMLIHEASSMLDIEIRCAPGWACTVRLPSGWNAAVWFVDNERKGLPQNAKIHFLYKD